MAKIYVVTEGCYSDYRISGVFTTEEKANAACALLPGGDVNEFDLDPVSPHPAGLTFWHVNMRRDGVTESAGQKSVSLTDAQPEDCGPSYRSEAWAFSV